MEDESPRSFTPESPLTPTFSGEGPSTLEHDALHYDTPARSGEATPSKEVCGSSTPHLKGLPHPPSSLPPKPPNDGDVACAPPVTSSYAYFIKNARQPPSQTHNPRSRPLRLSSVPLKSQRTSRKSRSTVPEASETRSTTATYNTRPRASNHRHLSYLPLLPVDAPTLASSFNNTNHPGIGLTGPGPHLPIYPSRSGHSDRWALPDGLAWTAPPNGFTPVITPMSHHNLYQPPQSTHIPTN